MMVMTRSIAMSLAVLAFAFTPASAADETGLVGLHTLKRSGNKICMADHFHSGSSSGRNSRKEAEAAAISDWQGFTAWEYGSIWGSFALAESKTISCSPSSGWSCTVEARPCRRR